jgi:hypothetical protein
MAHATAVFALARDDRMANAIGTAQQPAYRHRINLHLLQEHNRAPGNGNALIRAGMAIRDPG